MSATAREPRPPLPRPIRGVRVDHSALVGNERARVSLLVDFEPPAVGQEEDFVLVSKVASGRGGRQEERLLEYLGSDLSEVWEQAAWPPGDRSSDSCRVRAVLREATWKGPETVWRKTVEFAAELAVIETCLAMEESRAPRAVGSEALPRPPALPCPLIGGWVNHRKQTGCPSQFARARFDAEPLSAEKSDADVEFVADLPEVCAYTQLPVPREYVDAFRSGFEEFWRFRGLGRAVYATRVTLRDARMHLVDSSELSFRIAGTLAARKVLNHIGGDR